MTGQEMLIIGGWGLLVGFAYKGVIDLVLWRLRKNNPKTRYIPSAVHLCDFCSHDKVGTFDSACPCSTMITQTQEDKTTMIIGCDAYKKKG